MAKIALERGSEDEDPAGRLQPVGLLPSAAMARTRRRVTGRRAQEDERASELARRQLFGAALTEALAESGVSQSELARRLGTVTQSAVSDWCRAVTEPTPHSVFAIERALRLVGGTLARHLGYLPDGPSAGFEAGLLGDPLLTEAEKFALLTIYRQLTSSTDNRSSSSPAASKEKRAIRR